MAYNTEYKQHVEQQTENVTTTSWEYGTRGGKAANCFAIIRLQNKHVLKGFGANAEVNYSLRISLLIHVIFSDRVFMSSGHVSLSK